MNTVVLLYHLARADFLERVRRSGFLITLVGAMYLGYIYLPDVHAGYITVAIDNTRGIYNSAWVGAVCSLMSSVFLSLIGFYLVKNAVARDYQTRVGQILAGTPMTKFQYLLGKTLSNFAVLTAVVMAVLASAAITQIIRGEDTAVQLWQLLAPSLFFALPYLLIVSSLAVLFEVTPVLRGVGGNVIYFFVWNFLLIASLLPAQERTGVIVGGYNDPAGMSQILAQITQSAHAAVPNLKNSIAVGIQITDQARTDQNYVWSGIDWTSALIGQRMLWLLAALGVVLLATVIFRRFDTVESRKKPMSIESPESKKESAEIDARLLLPRLTSLPAGSRHSFVSMLAAELRLMFRSVNRWWMFVALALIVATVITPITVARQYIFPIAWIWPLAIWSSMATREKKFGLEQLVFSCPESLKFQFPALWSAGVSVAAVMGAGMAVRFMIAGDMHGLIACLVGMLFIPTAALAFGALSGSQLLFEGVYVALWYIGPMNQVPFLDFMGASAQTAPSNTLVFAVAVLCLAVLAMTGRRRQMSI